MFSYLETGIQKSHNGVYTGLEFRSHGVLERKGEQWTQTDLVWIPLCHLVAGWHQIAHKIPLS